MSGQVLAFPAPAGDERERLLAVLPELHALISIDPILGVTPTRIIFVLNSAARDHIAGCIDVDDKRSRRAVAYAMIAYDFPFALQQFAATASRIPTARAQEIIACSAGLQPDSLVRAAEAFGLEARPVPGFEAAALKQAFFPATQETVTHLFQLSLA